LEPQLRALVLRQSRVCVNCPREDSCDFPKRVYVKVKSKIKARGGGRQSVKSLGFCRMT
jgi:hypothetical protein